LAIKKKLTNIIHIYNPVTVTFKSIDKERVAFEHANLFFLTYLPFAFLGKTQPNSYRKPLARRKKFFDQS